MKYNLFILIFIPLVSFSQFIDDFSDGEFSSNPEWFGDELSFEIDSNNSLHLYDTIANISSLVTNSQALMNGEWVFSVRLDFSPSTNNYAKVYLVSDMINLQNPLQGMYVRIGGQSGNVDDLSLYVQNGTNHNMIIDGTDGLLTDNPDIRVKVTRDVVGNWELFLDTNGIFFSEGIAFDNSIISSEYFGVYCKYTVTRSDKFWFDEFSVNGSALSFNEYSLNKKLINVVDLLGRESKQNNQILFYIYKNGTVEKRISIE